MAPRQRILTPQSSQALDDSESSTLLSEDKRVISKTTSTLNQTEADIACKKHDYFNLIALVPIIVSTALNYDYSAIEQFEIPYTGAYFWTMWATTLIYFFVDLVWVARVPICVKSPGIIIKHHSVALVYLIGPIFYPQYRWFMGSILSVEVNTWFLIARRVVYKASGKPVSPIISEAVSAMFYITWIWIRCIVYPGVLLTFLQLAKEKIEETGTYFHLPMIFIPFHFGLCVLNLKWTYDLFTPIIKRWLGMGPKSVVVEKGL